VSNFVKHEPCSQCGSRNNLGVWDDGHKWCFGCGYYQPGDRLGELLSPPDRRKKKYLIKLPEDYTTQLPKIATEWLDKYHLTKQEIAKHGIGYSDMGIFLVNRSVRVHPLLILPIWEGDIAGSGVSSWQGRYLGLDKTLPKYVTFGDYSNHLPVFSPPSGNTMVVICCEDVISAIKISRAIPAMPLLGSFLSKESALRLSKFYHNLTFWLDYDKAKEAVKQADAYRPFFDSTNVIITERDPKDYSTKEIQDYVFPPQGTGSIRPNFDYA